MKIAKCLKQMQTSTFSITDLLWALWKIAATGLNSYCCVFEQERAIEQVWPKRELFKEKLFADNFSSQKHVPWHQQHGTKRDEDCLLITVYTRASWQPSSQHRHQHFVCCDFSVPENCKSNESQLFQGLWKLLLLHTRKVCEMLLLLLSVNQVFFRVV